ncbi:hypothetical protein HDU96_003670 [Phlyctochytrium bullatum]|nr:hypothetical protein HDU96_003670 [Phlyctochytrium bullatum]
MTNHGKVHPAKDEELGGDGSIGRQPRKSYQLKALVGKTISFQKRQTFTNVCCICLCPLIMVLISAVVGRLIMFLIEQGNKPEDYIYCGKEDSLTSDGFPIFNSTDPALFKIGDKGPKVANFVYVLNVDPDLGFPGAALLTADNPCVHWFSNDYPRFSPIYEKNAGLQGLAGQDSTYIPPPNGGWLGFLMSLFGQMQSKAPVSTHRKAMLSTFSRLQLQPWAVYGASSQSLLDILGARPQQSPLSTAALTSLLVTRPPAYRSYATTTNAAGQVGLLGSWEGRYYLNTSAAAATADGSGLAMPVPYFVRVDPAPKSSGGSGGVLATVEDVDVDLNDRIRTVLNQLASLNKSVLTKDYPSDEEFADFYERAAAATAAMPYGAIYVTKLDPAAVSAGAVLHAGTDIRISAASTYPSAGKRAMWLYSGFVQAWLRTMASLNGGIGGVGIGTAGTITQGVRAFPEKRSNRFDLQFAGLIGRVLYPFGISFLMPIFVITLVREKETRILIMMQMNGMKPWAYILTQCITFFILYMFSAVFFVAAGLLTQLTLFTMTEMGLLWLLIILWGIAQIALAFFFASLFNKSRIALVSVFLISLCGVIISISLEQLFKAGANMPVALFIWPQFAFYRALGLLNRSSYNKFLTPYKMSMVKAGDEVYNAIWFLILDIILYFLLAFYLSSVLPSEFGVRKPWHFPVTETIKFYQRYRRRRLNGGVDPDSELALAQGIQLNEAELKFEDADVKAERQRVLSSSYPSSSPLVVCNMRKVYGGRRGLGPKLAVKDVTFAAEDGIVFGLLGPNGAGKTTLISILTGVYEASSGVGRLAGFDIKTQSSEVYKIIGVCPQFDILWDDLTVGEHLYFYARLKGINKANERAAVVKSLENVGLTTLEHRKTKGLSGGEKRRLSIAIALVGDPVVVFLDEPTTGLDPEVRRLIWSIVQKSKKGKTIVLTTHSMEEAEALCQRIGIMAKGTLRCLANPLRLKELYGSGFRIFFNSLEQDTARASTYVESLLPQGWRKVDAFATNTSYEFPPAPGIISDLFTTIEANKAAHGILDWGVSQTTLEEVFLKIISEDDANAD